MEPRSRLLGPFHERLALPESFRRVKKAPIEAATPHCPQPALKKDSFHGVVS